MRLHEEGRGFYEMSAYTLTLLFSISSSYEGYKSGKANIVEALCSFIYSDLNSTPVNKDLWNELDHIKRLLDK